MRSRRVSKGNHRAAGVSQTGPGGSKSVQEDPKGKQKGGKRTQGGGRRLPEVLETGKRNLDR